MVHRVGKLEKKEEKNRNSRILLGVKAPTYEKILKKPQGCHSVKVTFTNNKPRFYTIAKFKIYAGANF